MRRVRAWLLRFGGIFVKQKRDRELAEELATHLQMHIEDNIRSGMSPQEARRWALLKLGGIEQAKELHRDQSGIPLLETFWGDIRFAVRMLRKNAGFTAVAVFTLLLGIGANTAMFSVINGVLLRPLPYPEPNELVRIHTQRSGRAFGSISEPEFVDLEAFNSAFEAFGLYTSTGVNLSEGEGEPEHVTATRITPGLLDTLRVRPQLGRPLAVSEGEAGSHRVAIISDGLWKRRFGADPGVLGHQLRILNDSYQIIGVMPPGFAFPDAETSLWVGYGLDRAKLRHRGAHFSSIIARLGTGVTVAQAQAEIDSLSERLRELHPDIYQPGSKFHFVAQSYMEDVTGAVRPALLILMAAAGLVLFIACGNVANLLLTRLAGREREITIRSALGASRTRLLRQILTECLVLGMLAGLAALAAARWAFDWLIAMYPDSLPRLTEARLDTSVLLFNTGLALLATLAVGGLSAIGISAKTLSANLRAAGRTAGGAARSRSRSALVVAEVALATVLLVGAGLLVRSLHQMRITEPGFGTAYVLTAQLTLSPERYPDGPSRQRFYRQLMDELSNRRGIVSAAAVNFLPLCGDLMDWYVGAEGYLPADPNADFVQYRTVTPDYFDTLRIPLLQGRTFTDDDLARAQPVAIISEALARRFWGNLDPIGRRIRPSGIDSPDPWHIVVGVVGDIHHSGPRQGDVPIWYRCAYQDPWSTMALVVRTSGDPQEAVGTVKDAVRRVEPSQPVYKVRMMTDMARGLMTPDRLNGSLMALFAALALTLAAVGIYGVIANAVGQRTPEIGVRMTLGARRAQVLRGVLREGLALVVCGLGLGLAGAFALGNFLQWLLFGLAASDTVTLTGAAAVLLGVGVLACLLPAWRASRVDPLTALRHE